MNKLFVSRGIQTGMAILLATTVAISSQMDQKLAQSQKQNEQALRQYTWQSRTEIRKGGETKNVQMAVNRYDIYGTLQKTTVSSTPQQQLPTRGIRGLIAQKKKEDFKETLEGLSALARSYAELSPDAMQRFMGTASVTPEMNPQQKLFRVTGGNILQPGDSMTVWLDAVSRKQRRVEIHTTLDRKPVRIVSDFQDLPGGPNYMARSVIDYPSAELTLITENFDYQRSAR
jgi:hypothetical protein